MDNSDRFICTVSNIGFWDRGSDMILGSVLKLKIADLNGADWEYFTGGDGMKPSAQVPHCNDAKPLSGESESGACLTIVPLELVVRDCEV